ncbi:MAG: hypothetical protein ACREYF_07925 [Gammaproteobacteria bacterium]
MDKNTNTRSIFRGVPITVSAKVLVALGVLLLAALREISLNCYAQGPQPAGEGEILAPVAVLEQRKARIEEAIRGAEADVAVAEGRYERIKALLESHDATVAQLSAAKQRLDGAQQNLAAYRGEMLQIEQQLADAKGGIKQQTVTGAQGNQDILAPVTPPQSGPSIQEELRIKIAALEREKSQTQAALRDADALVGAAKGRYLRVRTLVENHDATVAQLNAARQGLEDAEQQLAARRAELLALDDRLSLARAEREGFQDLSQPRSAEAEAVGASASTLESRKARAQQAIEAAQAKVATARNHYQRIAQLFNNRDATKAQLELAKQGLILAETELLDAKTVLSNIEN